MIEFYAVLAWAVAATGYVLYTSRKTLNAAAYKELAKVKDETIAELQQRVRGLRGTIGQLNTPPRGITGPDDFSDITSALPKWARPLAGPVIEWAKSNPEKITALIERWKSTPKEGEQSSQATDTL